MRMSRREKRRRLAKLSRTMDRLESMQLALNPDTRKLEPVGQERKVLAAEDLVQTKAVNG